MTSAQGHPRSTRQDHALRSTLTLGGGYLLLLVGVVAAFVDPATGYELSLYAETPLAYFLGIGGALLVSVWLAFLADGRTLVRDGALALGSLSVFSLVMLPAIRGYHLFVGGDSLTHLGWTRELLGGSLEPTGLLYPAIHTMTVFVSEVTGVRLGLAQLYVTLAYVVVFVVFVVLCVRLVGRQRWAVPVGLFAALLLLPNNNISVHVQAHPITQSLFFLPFLLYLLLRYVRSDGEWMNPFELATQNGLLLVLASLSLILIHPQGALSFILVMLTLAVTQHLFRRYRPDATISSHRPLYVPAGIAVTAFLLWSVRYDRVRSATVGTIQGILNSAVPGDEIAQRSTSISAIGGSVEALFVKLFLVALVFSVFAGAFAFAWSTGRLEERFPGRHALITYLVLALAPLVGLFVVFFAGSANTMHFRYVGFIMVPVTILGALALSEGAQRFTGSISGTSVAVVLVVLVLLFLPLPLATIHSTPFIYKSSSGVTEMHYEGANQTFETMDREVAFAGIRSGPKRFIDARYGTERSATMAFDGEGVRGAIPEAVWGNNLSTHYEAARYVPVAEADYQREAVLYEGLRYGQPGFDRLDRSPAIQRVQSNGGYRLYLVRPDTGG